MALAVVMGPSCSVSTREKAMVVLQKITAKKPKNVLTRSRLVMGNAFVNKPPQTAAEKLPGRGAAWPVRRPFGRMSHLARAR